MPTLAPKLSIVISTHCRPKLLERALQSILNRSADDYEIILCSDDGDKATFDVAFNHLRLCDTFLRIPFMKGPSESRNMGVSVARGDWICFLDDDDTFGEKYLQNVMNLISNSKKKCVYFFNYQKIVESRENGVIICIEKTVIDISKRDLNTLLVKNFIPIHAMIFPADFLSKHLFDCYLQSHEDWDFVISLLEAGAEFQWIENDCDAVRVHIDIAGVTRNNGNFVQLDYLSIYRKWPAKDDKIKRLRAKKFPRLGVKIS